MKLARREEFDELFDQQVIQVLEPLGFQSHGKSIFRADGLENVGLIRLGGRMASPGWAVWMLCFRHSHLRDIWERQPVGFVKDIKSYPFRFRPDALQTKGSWRWRYKPLTGPLVMEAGGIEWQGKTAASVTDELASLSAFIESRFLPWCRKMTPRKALWQLRIFGKNQWIERMWISDYLEFLAKEKRDSRE